MKKSSLVNFDFDVRRIIKHVRENEEKERKKQERLEIEIEKKRLKKKREKFIKKFVKAGLSIEIARLLWNEFQKKADDDHIHDRLPLLRRTMIY